MNKNEVRYHFLTASTSYYNNNSFDELLKESEKYNNYIYWHIGKHKIYRDDVCYIYYSNLPDGSSRILFFGEVVDSDLNYNYSKSICPDAKNDEKYAKLNIKSISFEDNQQFNLDNLRNKYDLISQKGQFSYLKVDQNKHKNLINDIDDSIKEGTHKLKKVHEDFEKNYCICEFGCKTFVEENGFHYMERHHLVERNLISKYQEIENIEKIINNKNNLFNLCPLCHKKIHHAKKEERMKMIEFLYNKNKKYFDNEYNQIKGNKNTIDWLYEIYKCK